MQQFPLPKDLKLHSVSLVPTNCQIIVVVERQFGLPFLRNFVATANGGGFSKSSNKSFPVPSIVNTYVNRTKGIDDLHVIVHKLSTLVHSCHGLENGNCLIPDGIYELTVSHSPKFACDLPGVCDVPNRSGIRIHAGNTAKDSSGCLLLGISSNCSTLLRSRDALNAFMRNLSYRPDTGEPLRMCIIYTSNINILNNLN